MNELETRQGEIIFLGGYAVGAIWLTPNGNHWRAKTFPACPECGTYTSLFDGKQTAIDFVISMWEN